MTSSVEKYASLVCHAASSQRAGIRRIARGLGLLPIFLFAIWGSLSAGAAEFKIAGQKFTVPDGLVVEKVAGPPLVDRPVSADFDEQGRLYVTDSSGTNEPIEVQLKKRPHCIRRLEDVDGDGRFDKSTLYADKLMFPEGALWHDGSLYVAAPPQIWKFTDADDDGVAEHREVWFDGKTLTHCANDLHGPYLGPDGWFYWCKGAFAEQPLERHGLAPATTRAAHIFRRRPGGGPVEYVMTGGMDNPVEVVFMPGGERFFTTTFIVHPDQGRRDGVLHAVYGGVYGKDHGVLDNHPRTGPLMPVLAHLDAAAPCGLARLESAALGAKYRNNILACLFNMHKVTRHALTKSGATFESETQDLLTSDHLDFHPTDVLEDADGSVLVVDTGGWFRLCCPTSQLEKPDVYGGIYRIRAANAKPPQDPRGTSIRWDQMEPELLADLLGDDRPAVRNQALQRLGRQGPRGVEALRNVLVSSKNSQQRASAVWGLTRIDGDLARRAVHVALDDSDETVRQAALHSISVRRDRTAADKLTKLLKGESTHNRRAAAEALGRVGSAKHIHDLFAGLRTKSDGEQSLGVDGGRVLEHSLIYAAMELNQPAMLRRYLTSDDDELHRAALIALESTAGLQAEDVAVLLNSDRSRLNDVAWWIALRHPEWANVIVDAFRQELATRSQGREALDRLATRIKPFVNSPAVQEIMGERLQDSTTSEATRLMLLNVMATARLRTIPAAWAEPLQEQLAGSPEVVRAALAALQPMRGKGLPQPLVHRLEQLSQNDQHTPEVRLRALLLLPAGGRGKLPDAVGLACGQLGVDSKVVNRSLAVEFLTSTSLSADQLRRVARELPRTGGMELPTLVGAFAKSKDAQVGRELVDSLDKSPAALSLFPDRLEDQLSGFGEEVLAKAEPLLERIRRENARKVERVEEVLALLPEADARRGLAVFQGTRASCIACHRRGYLGGRIGPDLNRIGRIRSERDLLESILFPSLSFVRNYEPVSIVTDDGRVHSGVVIRETEDELTLQLDAQKSIDIAKSTIEDQKQGTVSIMPAGLDKQLTPLELADLVKYLKDE